MFLSAIVCKGRICFTGNLMATSRTICLTTLMIPLQHLANGSARRALKDFFFENVLLLGPDIVWKEECSSSGAGQNNYIGSRGAGVHVDDFQPTVTHVPFSRPNLTIAIRPFLTKG
jgi:hypothetical protein